MTTIPLYLNARELLIVCYEAPALCIKSKNKSDQLFPLRKIERIQVCGHVEWKSAALMACIKHGISIQFVNKHGDTLGRLIGAGKKTHSLNQHFDHLFQINHWQPKYQQWCHAKKMQSKRYVAKYLNIPFKNAKDLNLIMKWTEQRLSQYPPHQLNQVLKWLGSDLYGSVNHYLQYHCQWRDSTMALIEPFDLAQDITDILFPVLLSIREKELKKITINEKIVKKTVVTWFKRNESYIYYQIARMVNQLEIWIIQQE